MKKILMSFLALLGIAMTASAQTDKGDWMVGGNIVIKTPKDNSQYTIQPSAGYFFARNFVAGADVALNWSKVGDEKRNSQLFGPFARYYISLKSPEFKPFFHAEFNIGNQVTEFSGSKSSNTTRNYFLGAGGAFFINSNVALEGVAGYTYNKLQGSPKETGFLFRFGFQVHLLGSEVERVRGR